MSITKTNATGNISITSFHFSTSDTLLLEILNSGNDGFELVRRFREGEVMKNHSRATFYRAVARLVDRGYLTKGLRRCDGQGSSFGVTEEGRERFDKLHHAVRKMKEIKSVIESSARLLKSLAEQKVEKEKRILRDTQREKEMKVFDGHRMV